MAGLEIVGAPVSVDDELRRPGFCYRCGITSPDIHARHGWPEHCAERVRPLTLERAARDAAMAALTELGAFLGGGEGIHAATMALGAELFPYGFDRPAR